MVIVVPQIENGQLLSRGYIRHSRESGNPDGLREETREHSEVRWIPAFAGMTRGAYA